MPQADRRPALAALFVFFLSLPSPTGALSTEAPAPPSVEFGELYRARSCLDERPLIKGYFRRCTGRGCGHVFGLLARRVESAGPDVVR